MNLKSKLAIVAACAVTGLGAATASAAADLSTFAQYTQIGRSNNLGFTQSASQTGRTFATNGAPTVNFSFLDSGFTTVAFFTFSGTVADGNPATVTGPSEYQQDGLNGSFSFLSKTGFMIDSVNYAAGTNLLSATFSDAAINSTGTCGSVSNSTLLGHSIVYTSSVLDVDAFTGKDVSFTLTSARPAITATAGHSLSNFSASSTGSFAGATVPEPSSWALMLLGFGGIGAIVRRRRSSLPAPVLLAQ